MPSQLSYPQASLISSFWGFTSHSYTMKSGAPQGWILGSLLFNVFITYICDSICKYRCLLFTDDSKNFHDIRNDEESKLLQTDTHSLQKWCLVKDMKLNVNQTTCINLTRKTSSNAFVYKLSFTHIAHSQYVKDLGVILDSKVHLHNHVDHIVVKSFKMLVFLRCITAPLVYYCWHCFYFVLYPYPMQTLIRLCCLEFCGTNRFF